MGTTSFVKTTNIQHRLIATLLVGFVLLTGCSSDIEDPTPVSGNDTAGTGQNNTNNPQTDAGQANNGTYSLILSRDSVNLVEGNSVSVTVQIQRSEGYDRQVTLALEGQSADQLSQLSWEFDNTRILPNQSSTTLTLFMDYSALPIQRQNRTVRIIGTDGGVQSVSVLNIDVEPTSLPDIYLLAGQSNMVGFSELQAKQAFAGGADAPDDRIQQLNVTGNDGENFTSTASFTDTNAIAVPSPRRTPAVDPLHDGYDSSINGKESSRIGLGISFAKRAIANTRASIYLVPAAWSDTGFCRRTRADFEGVLGWNATSSNNPALSGTLLHDRAIARANLALQETGGILRGILWHQGEADSDDLACAQLYEQNIRELVNSLRTNIIQDARGAVARGPNANIPFVVGTMSRGGAYADFNSTKSIVDGVHRNIKNVVPFSAFVNNDDLVPPAYPCGEGDCIHFGSSALRQMGSRYYDFLIEAAIGQ